MRAQDTPQPAAQAAAPSEPQQASTASGCELYRTALRKYDWDVDTAMAVMQAESGCNPLASNKSNADGSNDAGLFQINSIHVTSGMIGSAERYNVEANIRAAWKIYHAAGWSAWSAYTNGSYLRFMKT